MGGGVVDGSGHERLPEAVYWKIFQFLPAAEVARNCARVCRSWRDMAGDALFWQLACEAASLSSLSARDAMRCLGGWRSLFGLVYGQSLLAAPYFESVHHMDADRIKDQALGPWEPKHRLVLDRIVSMCPDHDDHHPYSYWAVEGGSVFQRGGGDGICREATPVGCAPCPGAPNKPVLATSYEWGKVQQFIGLPSFSNRFLDSSPPLVFSLWYVGRICTPGMLRVQIVLRDGLKNTLLVWDSGDIFAVGAQWRKAKRLIRGYPSGLRSIIVKIAGTSASQPPKRGYYGIKFTDARLQFVPNFEVEYYEEKLGKVVDMCS